MVTRDSSSSNAWQWFFLSPFSTQWPRTEDRRFVSMANRRPIERHERLAFPHPNSLKRAALLVDRIYIPCWSSIGTADVPLDLTFGDPGLDRGTYSYTRSLDKK